MGNPQHTSALFHHQLDRHRIVAPAHGAPALRLVVTVGMRADAGRELESGQHRDEKYPHLPPPSGRKHTRPRWSAYAF